MKKLFALVLALMLVLGAVAVAEEPLYISVISKGEQHAFWQTYGDSYFFENVRSILSEDDITFANFEGTLTTLDTRENKQYAFKGDPSYTDILLDGSIDSVTLANNHSSDYGAQSLTDTQQYLEEAGIDYCTGDKIIVKEVNGVKVGLIGIYVLDEEKMRLAKSDLVVLHPLPRVDEITVGVDDDPRAKYFEQAEYGMYARMALIIMMLTNRKGTLPPAVQSSDTRCCKNPRCVTNTEAYVPHLFYEHGGKAVCKFCDSLLDE